MGIPVLHGVAGESAEIVTSEEVGLVFEPENALQLCNELQRMRRCESLRAKFRERGVAAARGYDRTKLAKDMLGSLQRAVAEQPKRYEKSR